MFAESLGSLPTTDLDIGSSHNYPYTFVFSVGLFTSISNLQTKLQNDLAPYATNITVTDTGTILLRQASVELTPISTMPFSSWQSIFAAEGLDSMTDMTVGVYSVTGANAPDTTASEIADTLSTPLQNEATFYAPILSSIESGLGSAFTWVEYVAIAGAVIVGGILLLKVLPSSRD